MNHSFKLNVEGFGKIKKASVEVSPLMVFAGENNTGKSYMMSLLWGIYSVGERFLLASDKFDEVIQSNEYKKCEQWLDTLGHQGQAILSPDEIEMFIDLFNVILDRNKRNLVKHIFNYEVGLGRVYLSDPQFRTPISVLTNESADLYYHERDEQRVLIQIPWSNDRTKVSNYETLMFLCWEIVLGELKPVAHRPLYLPASRTGFMMTYKTLAQSAIRRGFSSYMFRDTEDLTILTLPVQIFLTELIGLSASKGYSKKYLQIAKYLEQEILKGEVTPDQTPTVPNFVYKPENMADEIPLHVTSSLVTELSPLLLFLKYPTTMSSLIIEEPEAHLHLDMQKKMAIALVRLVNAGLPVWITTHSDTMFQQLNNLIKLNNNQDRDALAEIHGYTEQDFLDPSKVRAYQFNSKQGYTEIVDLPLTSSGYSIPTFSDSLMNLTKETIEFTEPETDEEDDE